MKEIIINSIKYNVYAKNENETFPMPHITIAATGEIPTGKQLGLMKSYLKQNGKQIIDNPTTHWCVNSILGIDKDVQNKEKDKKASAFLELTVENIEEQDKLVSASENYGKEALIIHDVLNAYPKNNDLNTIAMKIALIDVTNSTHLSQYKSQISLYDLATLILKIKDFDEQLAHGNPNIVNAIAKNNGAINLFSFASKYCTYHNVEIYKRDDYSIFDGIVKKTLPHYVSNITANKIDSWRCTYNYKQFNECIGRLLDEKNINIPFRRRKFDHFLWYANR